MSVRWTRLSCPARCTKSCCPGRYTAPIASISNTEFVLAHHHDEFKGLCTCDSERNEWNEIDIEYPENFKLGIHSIAIDPETKTVFLCNQSQLLSISLGTKQNELISKQKSELLATFQADTNGGRVGQVFYIPKAKQIHIINFKTHYIMDFCHDMAPNMHRVMRASAIFEGEANTYLDPGSMMFIKSKQSLIGRRFKVNYDDITSITVSNSISQYSLQSLQWVHHKQWIPLRLIGRVGRSVITKAEDYIFSVGAQQWKSSESDFDDIRKILIYDVSTQEFDLSALETPSDQLSFVSMTNNTEKDSLLVFGFCRFAPDLSGYSTHLPIDVVGALTKWICFETVHFVADNPDKDVADHWIVDVDDVLATKQCIEWREERQT